VDWMGDAYFNIFNLLTDSNYSHAFQQIFNDWKRGSHGNVGLYGVPYSCGLMSSWAFVLHGFCPDTAMVASILVTSHLRRKETTANSCPDPDK